MRELQGLAFVSGSSFPSSSCIEVFPFWVLALLSLSLSFFGSGSGSGSALLSRTNKV